MKNAHQPPTLGSVLFGVATLLVIPVVPLDLIVATFTATPLRETVGVLLTVGVITGVGFWLTPGITIRAALSGDGGDG